MIQISDRPKILLRVLSGITSIDLWKKKPKKKPLDFCQNSMTRDMNWKLGKTGVAGDVQNLA